MTFTSHMARYTFVTDWIASGGSIKDLLDFGWSPLGGVIRYIGSDVERQRTLIGKL